MKRRIGLVIVVVTAALGGSLSPAHAAVPRIPFTCGMVVTSDATVYLTRSVTCSTKFGIRVERSLDADYLEPSPTVTIDLNGKTLRGTGTGTAVDAYDYPFKQLVTVRHGVISDWNVGVFGSEGVRAKGVSFIDNELGMGCGAMDCAADLSAFIGNASGFHVFADAGGSVTRSTFIRNEIGARTFGFSQLDIDLTSFIGNGVGAAAFSYLVVSRTAFVKNAIAVRIEEDGPYGPGCPSLRKVAFKTNGQDVIGASCP